MTGLLTGACALAVSACGSGGHATTTTTSRAAQTKQAATTSPLARDLLATGEEPQYPAGAVRSFPTLAAWAAYESSSAAAKRELARDGFVAGATEAIGGTSNDGANYVEELGSATDARRQAADDARQAIATAGAETVRHFRVSGIPGAHGVLFVQPGGGGAGTNVYWTEGRCALFLGNGAGVSRVRQVDVGAVAIYRRTSARCP